MLLSCYVQVTAEGLTYMFFVFATTAQCAGVVPKLIFACSVNVTSLLMLNTRARDDFINHSIFGFLVSFFASRRYS